jgi:hypothetical protein
MHRISGASQSRVNGPCRKESVQTRATPMKRMSHSGPSRRKRWSPPKQVLEPEKSAALRGQIVQKLVGLPSAEDATDWAQRALGAKNPLSSDAAVEAAFASRPTELRDSAEAPCPRLRRPVPVTLDSSKRFCALNRFACIKPVRINTGPPFSALFTLWLSIMSIMQAAWSWPLVPHSRDIRPIAPDESDPACRRKSTM